jgi:hypothetical protein
MRFEKLLEVAEDLPVIDSATLRVLGAACPRGCAAGRFRSNASPTCWSLRRT